MHLGSYSLGQFAPLGVVCKDGSFTPSWPANVPLFTVYNSAGVSVASGKMPPMDLSRQTGSFAKALRLNGSFSVGRYLVRVTWVLGGVTFSQALRFDVVAGGSANGAVVSAHFYRRPQADFLVGRLDSNQRIIGRNPAE